jgi:hypothetical protein
MNHDEPYKPADFEEVINRYCGNYEEEYKIGLRGVLIKLNSCIMSDCQRGLFKYEAYLIASGYIAGVVTECEITVDQLRGLKHDIK